MPGGDGLRVREAGLSPLACPEPQGWRPPEPHCQSSTCAWTWLLLPKAPDLGSPRVTADRKGGAGELDLIKRIFRSGPASRTEPLSCLGTLGPPPPSLAFDAKQSGGLEGGPSGEPEPPESSVLLAPPPLQWDASHAVFFLLLTSLHASFWAGGQEKKGRGELSPLGSVRTPVPGPGQRTATVAECSGSLCGSLGASPQSFPVLIPPSLASPQAAFPGGFSPLTHRVSSGVYNRFMS